MKRKHVFGALTALSLLVLWIGAFTACSREGGSNRVIVKVNDNPITEGEFTLEYDYQCSFTDLAPEGEEGDGLPKKTEAQLKAMIFSDMLIPMAVVRARYGDKIPVLMAEADEIKKKISPDGSNFQQIARADSRDSNAKAGGSLGTVPRFGLPYPISRMIFTNDERTVVGPFISLVGCHILYIESKAKSAIPSGDTARAYHILLPFEPDRPDFMARMLPELKKSAKVEVVDPAYAKYISQDKTEAPAR